MKYSGRTTSYNHKRDDWKENEPDGQEPIQQITVFEVQWSKCPVEVQDEVRKLWSIMEYGNDHYYTWSDKENAEQFPVISEYLRSKNVLVCLIHWWW